MPAGDAGLDLAYLRQTVDTVGYLLPSHCEQLFTEVERLQAQLAAQQAVVEQKTRLNHQLAAECVERHYDQHRLRDQISALIVWIRARQYIESGSLTDEQLLSAVNGWAEFQSQAAQPEGEPR